MSLLLLTAGCVNITIYQGWWKPDGEDSGAVLDSDTVLDDTAVELGDSEVLDSGTTPIDAVDADLDGFGSAGTGGSDCDDGDPRVFPGAPEWCDGVQNDCSIADWTDAREAGRVTWVGSDGVWLDATLAWSTGVPSAPAAITPLGDDGTYYVCEDRWYVAFTASGGSLTIEGVPGAERAVLDAAGVGRVIHTEGTAVTLRGVTIRAGYGGGSRGNGGGVRIEEGSAMLDAVIVEESEAEGEGGGVFASDADLYLLSSTVRTSSAAGSGGGVYWTNRSADEKVLVMDDSLIEDCHADQDGGGLAAMDAGVQIVGSTLQRNDVGVDGEGGSLYIGVEAGAGTVSLQDLSILDSDALDGTAGGYLTTAAGGALAFDSSLVSGNIGCHTGGLVLVGWDTIASTDLRVVDNTAIDGSSCVRAGIDVRDVPSATFTGLTVTGNRAYNVGGMYISNSVVTLNSPVVTGNYADHITAGIMVTGATLTILDDGSSAATVSGNTAVDRGGGITMEGGAIVELVGVDLGDGADDNTGEGVASDIYFRDAGVTLGTLGADVTAVCMDTSCE